jgi:beta-phosphoglucomutase-like phosphatase (HAD superfamily)
MRPRAVLFDFNGTLSDDVAAGKPDPEGYLRASS